jgi:hypothetical protein
MAPASAAAALVPSIIDEIADEVDDEEGEDDSLAATSQFIQPSRQVSAASAASVTSRSAECVLGAARSL